MTLLETFITSVVTGCAVAGGLCVVLKFIDISNKKDERRQQKDRQRFEKAIQAIHDAETLEEKIFRSDPENDDKPFVKKECRP